MDLLGRVSGNEHVGRLLEFLSRIDQAEHVRENLLLVRPRILRKLLDEGQCSLRVIVAQDKHALVHSGIHVQCEILELDIFAVVSLEAEDICSDSVEGVPDVGFVGNDGDAGHVLLRPGLFPLAVAPLVSDRQTAVYLQISINEFLADINIDDIGHFAERNRRQLRKVLVLYAIACGHAEYGGQCK